MAYGVARPAEARDVCDIHETFNIHKAHKTHKAHETREIIVLSTAVPFSIEITLQLRYGMHAKCRIM